jgi:hypothetical protein
MYRMSSNRLNSDLKNESRMIVLLTPLGLRSHLATAASSRNMGA